MSIDGAIPVEGEKTYSASMEIGNVALRDQWMRHMAMNRKIGQIYSSSGEVMVPGRSPADWLAEVKIFDSYKSGIKEYTPQQLTEKFLLLAQVYAFISAILSQLRMTRDQVHAASADVESDFVNAELSKYSPGGEHWDINLNKPVIKRPTKDTLQLLAKRAAREIRSTVRDLDTEVAFFEHVLSSLEYQRRCAKEYAEIMQMDPSMKGL